jgi:drug/metabolite transporter (DMT)-like permease
MPAKRASLPALVAGFAAIYLIWGSTYLGIKFAVETLPPFLMAGFRFTLAGMVLYAMLRLRGAVRPTASQWRAATINGGLLLVGGNGLVTWGQQQAVPSGIAALIVGTTPVWMLLAGWLLDREPPPRGPVWLGLIAGFAGVALLVHPGTLQTAGRSGWAVLALAAAPVCWSLGSIGSRRAGGTASLLLTSAMQMVAGGLMMIVAGTVLGEWPRLATQTVSTRSLLAFAYLTLIGSLVAFTTYTWLLRVASPAAVSTYAYVNPLVALFLGWLLGGEILDGTTLLAGLLIVGAVAFITVRRHRPAFPPAPLDDRASPARISGPAVPVGDTRGP